MQNDKSETKKKGGVVINTDLIEEDVARALALATIEAAKRFYNDPKNVEEFKIWQKNKNKNKN